jgi:hypothetical protein
MQKKRHAKSVASDVLRAKSAGHYVPYMRMNAKSSILLIIS